MDKQIVMKKVGTIVAWSVGIIAMLIVLVLVAKLQDNPPVSGAKLVVNVLPTDHVTGKLDSPVTVLEYSDFQCPACAAYAPIVEKLMIDYKDKVRFVYRSFPIYSKHPNAEIAARAGEAAGEQGKFFEFAALLFSKQSEWSVIPDPRDKFKEYATSLSLNIDDFDKHMNSKESKTAVTKAYDSGIKAGVNGTPTFFLNGTSISSPQGYEPFKKILDDALLAATPATNTSSQ